MIFFCINVVSTKQKELLLVKLFFCYLFLMRVLECFWKSAVLKAISIEKCSFQIETDTIAEKTGGVVQVSQRFKHFKRFKSFSLSSSTERIKYGLAAASSRSFFCAGLFGAMYQYDLTPERSNLSILLPNQKRCP